MTTPQTLPWRHAWVTGAGRGIGAALCEALSRAGVRVTASARNRDELEALQQRCANLPGPIEPAPLDITDPHQINDLCQHWQQHDDWPQLAVLNAGTHDPFGAADFSTERCLQLWQTNLLGTCQCLEPVMQQMLEAGSGHIAIMASSAGYRGLPTAAAYGAGKAALIHLAEALYLELQNHGVKLQLINPGFIRTPLTDKNEFAMPDLMEVDDAARALLTGLCSDRFEIIFPRRFVTFLKLLRLLPYRLYFPLIRRITGV